MDARYQCLSQLISSVASTLTPLLPTGFRVEEAAGELVLYHKGRPELWHGTLEVILSQDSGAQGIEDGLISALNAIQDTVIRLSRSVWPEEPTTTSIGSAGVDFGETLEIWYGLRSNPALAFHVDAKYSSIEEAE